MGGVGKELLQIKPHMVNRELPETGLTLELLKRERGELLQRCLGTLEASGLPSSFVSHLSGRICTTSCCIPLGPAQGPADFPAPCHLGLD